MENGEVDWVTKNNFEVGDIIYIYEVIPPRGRGGIVYKTEVIKTHLSREEKLDDRRFWSGQVYPKNLTQQTRFSRLKLISEPTSDGLSLEVLKERGFTAPQSLAYTLDKKPDLLSYIQKHFNNMSDERRNWTREETIIAFNLYCKIPFSEVTKTNTLIIKFAPILGRTPSALSMKIGNLGRLDPELKKRGISGLVNGSKLDEEIWVEFNNNWDKLTFESEKILAQLQGVNIEDSEKNIPFNEDITLPYGSDKETLVKARVNQSFFRAAVLVAYGERCCITGLSAKQLLVASHIIPWAKNKEVRTDPRNGLLLNSIHDKAFDAGFITITTDYKIKVSSEVHKLLPEKIIKEWFVDYEGKAITLPERFLPSKESLKWHNENVFRN